MTYTNIFFSWEVSDHSGWGVYGFNLFMRAGHTPPFRAVPVKWPPSFLYPVDPISELQMMDRLSLFEGNVEARRGDYMLTALGNTIKKYEVAAGIKEIGVIFFEINPLPAAEIEKLKTFDAIVAGSTWNQEKLAEMGVASERVIQGINTDLFRIQKKRNFKDRFVVFSGGKLECRKGQDIVLKAFSVFAKKHPEALLITSWRSAWEKSIAPTINASGLCQPLVIEEDFGVALDNWVLANGVDRRQFVNLACAPNQLMPEVLREVDLAVFPNRCEGGTNLVAMEALACGLTVAVADNTGQRDLVNAARCIALRDQSQVPSDGVTCNVGWGETSVDELLAVMEDVYSQKIRLNPEEVRNSVLHWTWDHSIDELVGKIARV